jgi:hypothetical protein
MSTRIGASVAVLLGILPAAAAAQGQPGPAGNGGAGYRAAVQAAAGEVGRQLDLLHDAIADTPPTRLGRGLWGQAANVGLYLASFKQQLRAGVSAAALAQAFDRLDGPLQGLVGDISALGPEDLPLKRAAARVRAAEADLHFAVFGGSGGGSRRGQVLARQALALRGAAANLERVAKYLLAGEDSWGDLQTDFRNLRRATGAFQQAADGKADPKQLGARFAGLREAWAELAVDFQILPATSRTLMQNYATRLDAVYGRLYGLMGQKGFRPSLVSSNQE